jgi:hypothetical protein
MFDERVSIDDLRTFWKGCIALSNGEPVFVINVGVTAGVPVVHVKYLSDGRMEKLKMDQNTLLPPDGRLGFANLNGIVYYVQRRPVRKFMMGISDSNIKIRSIEGLRYERGEVHNLNTTSMEFYRTLVGQYPSLEEAVDQVKTFGGACAFDRQFAIDEDRNLYYRYKRVGRVLRGAIDKRGLEFSKDYAYLKSVIGEFNHEEAVRTIGR